MRWIPPVILALAVSCSSAKGGEDTSEEDVPADRLDPKIIVDTPVRGTMSEDGQVTVTGTVTDNISVDRVEVNGHEADLDASGAFTATVPLNTGVNLIQTEGFDQTGNSSKDVRAVLAGTFAPQGTPVDGAVVAQVGTETLDVLAQLATVMVNNFDIQGIALSQNPLVKAGNSCFGLTIDVQSVSVPSTDVSVRPTHGGIIVNLRVDDPEIRTRWNWKVACLGGGHNVNVRGSSLEASAKVEVGLTSTKQISIALRNVQGDFKNFDYDVGAIPDAILDLADGLVEPAVVDQLVKLTHPLPEAASNFLAEFARQDWSLLALGQIVDLDIVPSVLEFGANGGTLALDASVVLRDVAGADYLVSPAQAPNPDDMASSGFSMGIADDLVNMVLAGFWASGALDQSFGIDEMEFVKAAFGEQVDTISANLSLPPTIRGDKEEDAIILTVGDLIVEILDEDDGIGTVAEFAISAEIKISASVGSDGRLRLVTQPKNIYAAVLQKSDAVVLNINEKAVTGFVSIAIDEIQKRADVVLQTVPLPTFGDAMLTDPSFESTSGYVLIKSGLTR